MVGRVCMDQFLVDVTDVARVAEGEIATLIGADAAAAISVSQVAEEAETISWDVLASLQARLPRFYHRKGAVEAIAPAMW
jgi:alanine racemase